MRALAVLAASLVVSPLAAQQAGDATLRRFEGGWAMRLPAAWERLDPETQAAIESQAQESGGAGDDKAGILLMIASPAFDEFILVNRIAAEGATRELFDLLDDADREELGRTMCTEIGASLGPLAVTGCRSLGTRPVAGRTGLLIETDLVVEGQRRTQWTVQFGGPDALLGVSFQCRIDAGADCARLRDDLLGSLEAP